MCNYVITDDITKATHWLAYEDEDSCVKDYIKPGKMYELVILKDPMDNFDDYFIFSEDGHYAMYYVTHNGDFIIKKKEGNL